MYTSLYVIPHQDDELFTFGVDIIKRIHKGERVALLLVVDGAKCWVKDMLTDGESCEIEDGIHDVHNFKLSEQDFVASRDKEFSDCCERLGVKREDIYYADPRLPDMGFSVEEGKHAILTLISKKQFDRVCVHAPRQECSFDPQVRNISMPPHVDHCFLGQACQELLNEGAIKNLEYCIEFYDVDRFKTDNSKVKLNQIKPTCEELHIIQNAGKAYKKWNPDEGRYAIGWHCDKEMHEDSLKAPVFTSYQAKRTNTFASRIKRILSA